MDINFLLIKHMRLHFGKPTLSTQILKSIFPVDESHTHALSRGTKHLGLDGQVCFYRRLISDAVKAHTVKNKVFNKHPFGVLYVV